MVRSFWLTVFLILLAAVLVHLGLLSAFVKVLTGDFV